MTTKGISKAENNVTGLQLVCIQAALANIFFKNGGWF